MSIFLQARQSSARPTRCARIRAALALFAGLLSFCFTLDPLAVLSQSQGRTVTLTRISTLKATGGTVVSIAADAPLYRAQTSQDGDTYRVLISNARVSDGVRPESGVAVSTAGDAVEIRVQVERGAKVTSWGNRNRLNLSIDGQLVSPEAATQKQALLDPKLRVDASPGTTNAPASKAITPTSEVKSAPSSPLAEKDSNEKFVSVPEESFVSSLFSKTSILIMFVVAAFGLLGMYKLTSRTESNTQEQAGSEIKNTSEVQPPQPENTRVEAETSVGAERADSILQGMDQPSAPSRPEDSTSTALYGAYRVDQEVGKLVLGQAHRLDVLASRSPDDRRAIETSLMKTIRASDAGEEARKRARQALEEYGFVARQCATLLLATEAFERMAAARTLGGMKSPIALPFLLEALYDGETSVRNESIASIGELKLPSAIGALLDLARRHPQVSSALLSRSLSACSVEGLDFFNDQPDVKISASEVTPKSAQSPEILESQVKIEQLPETLQNEGLVIALAALKDPSDSIRAQGIQDLGQFRTQIAVQALVSIVRSGLNPGFRALAISSLGKINHHSVFPAVLIGMADEAREVRAAAARALNRLTFDRGDAYVHAVETAGADTIRDVARACIHAGIVSQGIDRLASTDHRQAYEAFSLVSLLSRADMTDPVFDAIFKHPSLEVRLSAAKLLATQGEPKVIERLRLTAIEEGVAEEVRTALLEMLYKSDESHRSTEGEGATSSVGSESKEVAFDRDDAEELEAPGRSVQESEIGKGET